MRTNHLGERLSALVDGELDHAERDHALSHLAVCEPCRSEAETLRRLKRRLHGLDSPEPSGEFLGRLTALSTTERDGPFDGPRQGTSSPRAGFLSALVRREEGDRGRPPAEGHLEASTPRKRPHRGITLVPQRRRDAASERRAASRARRPWHRARYAVTGATLAVLTLGTAFFAAGGSREPATPPAPVAEYTTEREESARQETRPAAVSITTSLTVVDSLSDGLGPRGGRGGSKTRGSALTRVGAP